MERPGRPFGVSLAIIASVFMFVVLPMMQVGLILAVQQHFANQKYTFEYGGQTYSQMFAGSDFLGISQSAIFLQIILSAVFLIVAIMAWRGRPSFVRFAVVWAVVVLTVVKFVTIIGQTMEQNNLQIGVSSWDSIARSLSLGQLAAEILVTLYMIWYMNRGPARAFYRGYYLPAPSSIPTPDNRSEGTGGVVGS